MRPGWGRKAARHPYIHLQPIPLRHLHLDELPPALQEGFELTAYHFCGAINHLNILSRGGGKCWRTNLAVSLSCCDIFSQ